MEKKGGVYYIPCKVNGLGLKFIFDTGASSVSISLTEALLMLEKGYLNAVDLGDSEYYRIANGDIVEGTKVVLRKIEIGETVLYNVEASIVHSLEAPLLLGQSVMERLGQFTFDYSSSTLTIAQQINVNKKYLSSFESDSIPSVKIGNQVWMSENLNVEIFRNGDLISNAQSDEEWIQNGNNKQPAWCNYDNESNNGLIYGKLYNWYAVSDIRGLCPIGWHAPSVDEWSQLFSFLGGEELAGIKLKCDSGSTSVINVNNTDFCGLLGGVRLGKGSFLVIGDIGSYWSSDEILKEFAYSYVLSKSYDHVFKSPIEKTLGYSVRCLRD